MLQVQEYVQVQELLTSYVKETNIANIILEMSTKQIELQRRNHYFQFYNVMVFASVAEEISGKELKEVIARLPSEYDEWQWGNADQEERDRAVILLDWVMPSPPIIEPTATFNNATLPDKIVAIERRMRGFSDGTEYPGYQQN